MFVIKLTIIFGMVKTSSHWKFPGASCPCSSVGNQATVGGQFPQLWHTVHAPRQDVLKRKILNMHFLPTFPFLVNRALQTGAPSCALEKVSTQRLEIPSQTKKYGTVCENTIRTLTFDIPIAAARHKHSCIVRIADIHNWIRMLVLWHWRDKALLKMKLFVVLLFIYFNLCFSIVKAKGGMPSAAKEKFATWVKGKRRYWLNFL